MWRKRLHPGPPFVHPPTVVLTLMSGLSSDYIYGCCPFRLSPHNQPSLFPRYVFQSLTFSSQPPATLVDVGLSLGSRVAAQTIYADLSPLFFQNGCWGILSIWSFPSILVDLPAGEGGSQGGGSFPLIQLPLRGKCPVLISFSLSLFILFCPPQLCGDSSCPFRKFRSSGSIQ